MLINYDTEIFEPTQFADDLGYPVDVGDEAPHHTPAIEAEKQLSPRAKLFIVVALALVAWAIPISAAVFL
jgi:hypothetical protein